MSEHGTDKKKVGIIIGSIRDGRTGPAIAQWVHDAGDARGVADYEIIDLLDLDLPMMTTETHPSQANRNYDNPRVVEFSQRIDALDGVLLVSPEHNHSLPAPLKNAVDQLFPEWDGKVTGVIAYGGGSRHEPLYRAWKDVLESLNTRYIDEEIHISISKHINADGTFDETSTAALTSILDAFEDALQK